MSGPARPLTLYVSPVSGRIGLIRSSTYREPTTADVIRFGESCGEALERLFDRYGVALEPTQAELSESLRELRKLKINPLLLLQSESFGPITVITMTNTDSNLDTLKAGDVITDGYSNKRGPRLYTVTAASIKDGFISARGSRGGEVTFVRNRHSGQWFACRVSGLQGRSERVELSIVEGAAPKAPAKKAPAKKAAPRKSAFVKWFETYLDESNHQDRLWTLTANDGVEHIIGSDVVIEAIKNAPKHEQKGIKSMIVRIDFRAGDVNDYFRHLAGALINA